MSVLEELYIVRKNLDNCKCECDTDVGVECMVCSDRDLLGEAIQEIEQLQATVDSFQQPATGENPSDFQWKSKPPTLPGWYLRRQAPSTLIIFKQVTSFNGVLVTSHKERGKKKKLTPVSMLPKIFCWLGPVPPLPSQEPTVKEEQCPSK